MTYGTGRYGQDVFSTAALHPYANVTGKVMWIVQVDWGRDGSFSHVVEPQSIRRLSLKRGRSERLRADGLGQRQPENEVFEIEISDSAGRYDAFNVDGPLYPFLGAPGLGLCVYMVSTTSKTPAEPVFCGMLERVDYDSGRGAATLRGCGLSKLLEVGAAQQVFSPCQSGSLGAWDDWFSPGIPTVAPVNYWKGKPEGLYLNECVRLVLERAGWSRGFYAEPAVANDDQPDFFFMDGGTAWAQLKEIADAFCARLFFGRDGRLLVMSRKDVSGMGTLAGTGLAALRQPGLARESGIDSLRNVIEVNVRPRSVALFVNPPPVADYAAAWMNAGPVAVPPLSSVVMDVEYRHGGAAVQGSLIRANTDNPAESIAYAVWSSPDKSGTDMGPWLGTNEADFTALWEQHGFNAHGNIYVPYGDNQQRTRVQFTNRSASLTAYFFNTQVQIIPILEAGQAGIVTCSDSASVALNGRRVMNINSRWIQDAVMAANIGQAYCDALSGRERAAPVVLHYLWSGETLYQTLSTLDVGVYVDFGAAGGGAALANGGLTGRWLVVGQEFTWLGADGQSALVKLTFEKALDDF